MERVMKDFETSINQKWRIHQYNTKMKFEAVNRNWVFIQLITREKP